MTAIKGLLRNARGATAIEFAIALPILVMFVWGIFQIGLLFQANAGMQHALGEAARHATICIPSGTTCNPPSDNDIRTRVTSKKFGTYNGTLGTLQIADTVNASGGVEYKTLTLTYNHQMNFLFIGGPAVTLTRSKRVYLAS